MCAPLGKFTFANRGGRGSQAHLLPGVLFWLQEKIKTMAKEQLKTTDVRNKQLHNTDAPRDRLLLLFFKCLYYGNNRTNSAGKKLV